MANLISRTVFTGTLAGSDMFYGITDPGGTPAEWKIPLSKLTALYATAAQGVKADTAVQPASLALVATTGAYADLSGTPTLAAVATSGAYGDLSGTPTLGSLAALNSPLPVANGGTAGTTAGDARTNLGLGTIATQAANNVSISGGSISGITDLAIADGGTGQSTAQAAINALTAVSGATIGHVLTKSAGGDAAWAASAGGSSLPVADTQTIVMGSVDNTKLLRFEVDGFTAGATRVLTPPNADVTLAGQNFANVFSSAQSFRGAITESAAGTSRVDVGLVGATPRILLEDSGFSIWRIDNEDGVLRALSGSTVGWQLSTTLFTAGLGLSVRGTGITEAAVGVDRIDIGIVSGTPRMVFENAGGTIWEIDNESSEFRWFTAGNVVFKAAISPNRFLIQQSFVDIIRLATDGTSYIQHRSSATNSISNVFKLRQNTSGTPAAGFGVGLSFQGESSTTEDIDLGRLSYEWATATHASRKARSVWSVYDTAEREGIRIEASGTAPMLGVLGAAAIARQAHIVDPSGGGTVDAEARTAINAILVALESFGFLATS